MIKEKLTEREVKIISCPPSFVNIDILDGSGLELRVSRTGAKKWRYRYKVNGLKKIVTIGAYPEISLKEARKQSTRLSLMRKFGIELTPPQNVLQPKVIPEPVKQVPVTTKPPIKKKLIQKPEVKVLFKDVVDEYIQTLANKPSQKEAKRILYKDAIPVWGSRQAESIRLRECVLLLDKIAKRAPVLANLMYAFLKRAYVVSIQRGLITVNPLANLQKPAPEAEIRNNCDKVLTRDQLKQLILSVNAASTTMMDDALLMILWTGARPSEVLKMQWKQIEGDRWTLGAKEHKGGHKWSRSLTRPLIDAAQKILKKQEGLHEQYVFPGRFAKPSSHIHLSHHVRVNRMSFGVNGFTPNHLRHTISTRMRELGVRPDIVERIIGHHVDSGIIGVYSSYNWFPEMKEALVKWHEWIQGQ
ncbi:MAG: tyrosine-type recombinase/integrase [Chlorobiaceae bacterium]|nr:tyrosine-type recombinase/integrase [Chlorobiaceae bacterium]